MKIDKKNMLLYGVTDRKWTDKMSLIEQAEIALKNGMTCLQLREKELDYQSFLEEAKAFKKLCDAYNVPLIINDNVDIAAACKADGIHVGQDDMKITEVRRYVGNNMIIGASVHTVEEAVDAMHSGADYLGIGAVFPTSTKTNVCRMTPEKLKAITAAVNIPTVAIGGITKDNMSQLCGTGVDGIAVVSAIFGANNIEKAVLDLRQLAEKIFI